MFNYSELRELKGRIEARMHDMQEIGVPALRARFIEEATALGVTLEEVVASGKTRRGRQRKSNGAEQTVDTAV